MSKNKKNALASGWKVFGSKYLLQSPYVNVRQDDVQIGSRKFSYTFLEQPGAVFIVPITKNNEVLMIKIFRYPVDEWCWEVPSGTVGDKLDKSLEEIAREEMQEEAGAVGGKLEFIGTYLSANGVADLPLHYFVARNVDIENSTPEESEQIEKIEKVDLKEIRNWVFSGKINDGDSAFAVLLALNFIETHPL